MPRPGSHQYEVQRRRLRKQLEDEGLGDKEATQRANEILRQDETQRPQKRTDRAEGPKGER
ncbi:hypothetical protein HNP84_008656 [Thermocatellispora tengchongensis]|uniref:Phosphatidylethanolamine-binding protein n=1 Tax=Thermocatellispora tengchongensis TaxID=1073253 RepID=A0A840PBV6_9ACTN|nr:hypothetical protein [Thermocatellispora tengchongensis]MBB5138894.1 hypothetical protein [Thermocatellispora tengchongensis]